MNTEQAYYTKSLEDSDPIGPIHIVAFEQTLCGKDIDKSPGRWYFVRESATCKKCLNTARLVDKAP